MDDLNLRAAKVLATVINTANLAMLEAALEEDASLDTQSTPGPIEGKAKVLSFFKPKLEASKRDPSLAVRAEIGHLKGPGVIVEQDGIVRVFYLTTANQAGKICSIFGTTVVPSPETAERTGELPGFDPSFHRRKEKSADDGKRDAISSAKGPIIIHGFGISKEMIEYVIRPIFVKLKNEFPDAVFNEYIFNSFDDEELELGRKYDLIGYPAIAVEVDGVVIRGGRADYIPANILADLKRWSP